MLAGDCIHLMYHLFTKDTRFHIYLVYGASMGGCIAQHVALMLHRDNRLKSVYLAVTSRGNYWQLYLTQSIWKFIISNFIIWNNDVEMIQSLIPKCFDKEYLSPEDPVSGKTMEYLWKERWLKEFDLWFSFHHLDACVAQCSVFANHYISVNELKVLDAYPITIHIAEKDELMNVSKQQELAEIFSHATIVSFKGGHMTGKQDLEKFTPP